MSAPLLQVRDCHTYYGENYILHGVSLSVQPGQVAVIVGRNGMGKTTLLRSIIGLTPPRSGSIQLRGRELRSLPPEKIARLGVGLVPQGRAIFPSLRVHENLTVASRPGAGNNWNLERVYARLPRLKERAKFWGDQLSGGEQQMLAIARTLLTNPICLLMDEPFEGLAPGLVRQVADMIRELKAEGMAVLLVEQQVEVAVDLADYVYVMGKGAVVFEGTPAEFHSNDEIRSAYLGVS